MKRVIIDFWNQRVCAFLATLFLVSLCACGGDEPEIENENGGGTDPEINLSENAKKFVGSWGVSAGSNYHTFTFFPNKRAIRDSSEPGMWEYDEESKILATSVDMWQFQITMVMNNTWTGFTINTGRAVNASKIKTDESSQYFSDYMKMVYFSKDGYKPFDVGNGSIYYSDIVIDGSTIKANATARDYYDRNIGYANITITNAYSEDPQAVLDAYSENPDMPLMKGTYSGVWYGRE